MTRQERTGVAFALPVVASIALFFIAPTLAAFVLSVTDFDVYALADLRNVRFTGLGTFAELLGNPLFWRAARNTALFVLLGVPMLVGTSLAAALLLSSATVRWKPLWRVLLFTPYVTSLVATAVVWRYLLNTRQGLLNAALTGLGLPPVEWLGDPRVSIPAVLLFVTWKSFAYNMVVFTAALSAVPGDLMEAARLDGAGAWTRFRHVTLPALGPVLLFASLLSVAGFLQIFDEPYVMTQGGPAQSTLTISYFMFNQGFEWWSLGTASAVAVVLFALTLAVTTVQVRLGRRREWV